MHFIIVENFIEERVRETPQDDHRMRSSVVVQKESARRDRGTRSTLSKPQIYDVGGRERDHNSGLESQRRRRNRIRRHEPLFSFLLSIRSATRHALYLFFFSAYTRLSVYIVVHTHTRNTGATTTGGNIDRVPQTRPSFAVLFTRLRVRGLL